MEEHYSFFFVCPTGKYFPKGFHHMLNHMKIIGLMSNLVKPWINGFFSVSHWACFWNRTIQISSSLTKIGHEPFILSFITKERGKTCVRSVEGACKLVASTIAPCKRKAVKWSPWPISIKAVHSAGTAFSPSMSNYISPRQRFCPMSLPRFRGVSRGWSWGERKTFLRHIT